MVTVVTVCLLPDATTLPCNPAHHLKSIAMQKNMGTSDRIIRVIIAAIVAFLYFNGTISGTTGIILLVLAVVFVLTSLVSFCPLYAPFGIRTCAAKK